MLTLEAAASFMLYSCSSCALAAPAQPPLVGSALQALSSGCLDVPSRACTTRGLPDSSHVCSLKARGKVQISSLHVGSNTINAQNTRLFTKIVNDDSDIRIELRQEMMGRSRPCFSTFFRLLLLLVMLQEYGAVCFRPFSFKRVCCICSHVSQRAGQLC